MLGSSTLVKVGFLHDLISLEIANSAESASKLPFINHLIYHNQEFDEVVLICKLLRRDELTVLDRIPTLLLS